jgi:beta-phosphoglucomutase
MVLKPSAACGVLWDMDGVLVDTGELHFKAWAQALSEFGIHFSRQLFETTFGVNNFNTLALLLGEKPSPDKVDEIGGRKEILFREAVRGRVQPAPGVVDWLERLRAWGVRQAVASSAPRENIDTLIDEFQWRTHFDALVSGFDLASKPDPAVFLEAARRIGVSPKNCVAVEDAPAGVRAAKRAGMRCIALTTTHSTEHLAEADIILDGLDALSEEAFRQLLFNLNF